METKINDPKNILIVQIGKLGDMILTTPLFSNLKQLYPRSEITVLASGINFEIPRYHKDVDHILIYSMGSLKSIALLLKLLKCKFDVWIDTKPEYSRTSRMFLKYGKPSRSLGYNNDDCRFDVDLTEYKNGGHAVDINLAPIKALAPEFKMQSKLPSIGIPEDVKKFVNPLLNNLSNKILFLNLTAGMPARQWDPQNWIELLDLLSQNKDYDILVNTYGMPKDEVSGLKDKFSNIFFFPGKLEQLELAEVIRRSSVVISPDTSVIHMVSAFNVPVVNLMNNVGWNIERFAPLCEKQRVLISEEKNSLKGITPDIVYRAFQDLMNQ